MGLSLGLSGTVGPSGELVQVNSPSGSHLEGKVALYEVKHMKELVRQPSISAIRGQGYDNWKLEANLGDIAKPKLNSHKKPGSVRAMRVLWTGHVSDP